MGTGASLEAHKVMPQVRQEYRKLVQGQVTEEQACEALKRIVGVTTPTSPESSPAAQEASAGLESPTRRRHLRAHSWQRETQETNAGDEWETTRQPVCHLCKMVFPNQLKLDRHIQYSLVHKKNVEAQQPDKDKDKDKQEAAAAKPAAAPPLPCVLDMDVVTGQLMYSGSKFFWRSSESYDVYIYLHPHHNCVEVIACDFDVELRRLYLNYSKLTSVPISEVAMVPESDSRPKTQESDSRPSTPMAQDAHQAEQLRRNLTHFMMARLQLKTFVDVKGLCLQALSGDSPETIQGLTLPEAPAGLPHTSVRKRRRTSISDFNKLLDNFQQNAKALEHSTSKADTLVNASVQTVQQLTRSRRRQLHKSMSTLPEAKRRWDEASVKGRLVLDVDKTKRLLQEMADAVQQAENVIRSPDTRDPNT